MSRGFALLGACVAAVVLLGGCSSQAAGSPTAGSLSTTPPATMPYTLYTHCGIHWARILGVYWTTRQVLDDGSGNPPPGWGNPSQDGTLTFISDTTAVFTSPAGQVTFHRTGQTAPPEVCS